MRIPELIRVLMMEEVHRRKHELLENDGANSSREVKENGPMRVDMPDEHQVVGDTVIHHIKLNVVVASLQD